MIRCYLISDQFGYDVTKFTNAELKLKSGGLDIRYIHAN
jgi:hypothetical protein